MTRNNTSKKIKKEDILVFIREYVKEKNKTPTYHSFLPYIREKGFGCNPRSNCYFPNKKWNEILELAGVTTNIKGSYTKEELIHKLKLYAKKLGRTPTQHDLDKEPNMPTSKTFNDHFGTYNKALKEAGLPLNQEKLKYTREELLEIIQQFVAEKGVSPYQNEIESPSLKVFLYYFKNWGEAVKAAGFKPNPRASYGKCYESNHGHVRPSELEGKFDDQLGSHGILHHRHDVDYKEFIQTDREFNFDFVIGDQDGDRWFIEYAGMIEENEWTGKRKIEKGSEKERYRNKMIEKVALIKGTWLEDKFLIIFKRDKRLEEKVKKILDTEKPSAEPILTKGKIVRQHPSYGASKKKYSDEDLIGFVLKRKNELGRDPLLIEMKIDGYPYWSIYSKRKGFTWYKNEANKQVESNMLIKKRLC